MSNIDLFAGFNEEQLRLLAFGSQRLNFSAGTRIFHEGQSTDGGYLVLDGEVELVQIKGGMEHVVDIFRYGDLIGEMAMLTANRRVGSAVVVEDCELMKISRAGVHRILEEYPELVSRLQAKLMKGITSFVDELDTVEAKLRNGDGSK